MKTMDDYIPSDAEVVEGASRKRPAAILAAHFISVVLWVAFAMYDIHRNAAGNRAVPARVGAAKTNHPVRMSRAVVEFASDHFSRRSEPPVSR